MIAVAVYRLGLTEEQFWRLTPAKFTAMLNVCNKVEEFNHNKADYRAGLICATLANVNRGKKGKTFKASDFFPKTESKDEDYGQTPEQTYLKVRLFNARIKQRGSRSSD